MKSLVLACMTSGVKCPGLANMVLEIDHLLSPRRDDTEIMSRRRKFSTHQPSGTTRFIWLGLS